MAKGAPAKHFGPGARVRFALAGQEVLGTVVEDRGPLGMGGRALVRLQTDGSGSTEPNEFEAPAAELEERVMSPHERAKLEKFLTEAPPSRRMILDTALRVFRDELRHVSMGLWPDHLAQAVGRRTKGKQLVATAESVQALDDLASLGVVVRRPSGLYIATDWLLKYLDETSEYMEGDLSP